MKEIICLHIGQAGVQIGSGIWELLSAEHMVEVNGSCSRSDDAGRRGMNRFFYETPDSQIVPRMLMMDLESSVIDEVKSGYYKDLFSQDSFISGFEDSASIFSRGYFSLGRVFINNIINKIRLQIENCDTPQSLCLTHSSGGGTGSGLFSLIVEEMEDFSKLTKMDICIYPSFPISPVIVEPYNSLLTSHYTMDNTDISFLLDNDALYNLASKQLDQQSMNYHLINRITSQILSSISAATRFDGQSTTMSEYLHNLIPYPRIHFPMCSIAPLNSPAKQIHYSNTVYSITKDALSLDFQMLRCAPLDGKFMSCCLMYRGNISPGDVYKTVERMKCYERMQFVDWCPTGIKITICNRPSTIIAKSGMSYTSRSLTMLCNNSSIVDSLLQNTFRFHILFNKRAFVHWFVAEGMEEEEFKDSLENISCLIKDYEECVYPTKLLENQSNRYVDNDNSVQTTAFDEEIQKSTVNISDRNKSNEELQLQQPSRSKEYLKENNEKYIKSGETFIHQYTETVSSDQMSSKSFDIISSDLNESDWISLHGNIQSNQSEFD